MNRRTCADGFFEGWLRCPMGLGSTVKVRTDGDKQKNPRPNSSIEDSSLEAPLAHHRSGYPLPGCVPAEPDSVSPNKQMIPRTHENHELRTVQRGGPRSWLRAFDSVHEMAAAPRFSPPPLTIGRPHSSHAGQNTASAFAEHSTGIQHVSSEVKRGKVGVASPRLATCRDGLRQWPHDSPIARAVRDTANRWPTRRVVPEGGG